MATDKKLLFLRALNIALLGYGLTLVSPPTTGASCYHCNAKGLCAAGSSDTQSSMSSCENMVDSKGNNYCRLTGSSC
jgi:hypothetical protein